MPREKIVTATDTVPAPRVAALADALQDAPHLRYRRFEMVPLRGAVFTDVQGRGPGPSLSADGLADLISSISAVGVLQPVLIEEIAQVEGPPQRRLVVGERRYRAGRWGAVNQPENPHFASLPAIVCPGPLTEEEQRTWQLVENLAREDLQPGELAAALLLERSAVLRAQLEAAGIDVSDSIARLEDPVARFTALERLRGNNADLAAPWTGVLRRLGLQISPRRARELVAAFRTLPREISSEMDESQVALAARVNLARLARGRREAAAELWQAVKRLGRADLLSAAARAREGDPDLSADQAVAEATAMHERANADRAAKLSRPGEPDTADSEDDAEPTPDKPAASSLERGTIPADPHQPPLSPSPVGAAQGTPDREEDPTLPDADGAVVRLALDALRELHRHLSEGRALHRFDAGSLRLLINDLHSHLGTAVQERSAA